MSGSRRMLAILTVAVAALLLIVGVVYLVVQCQHIPGPLPGREAGSTRHRIGFAAVAFVAGVIAALGAVLIVRPRPRSG